MAYVLASDITKIYIEGLIAQCGYTDVTGDHEDWGELLVIQDLNGAISAYVDYSSARDWLIIQLLIQQNSP